MFELDCGCWHKSAGGWCGPHRTVVHGYVTSQPQDAGLVITALHAATARPGKSTYCGAAQSLALIGS